MKIGLVCPYSMAKGGGVQEIVKAMHKELTRRGHTVKIITPETREIDESHRNKDMIFVGGAADFKSPLHTTSQISATADGEGVYEMLEAEDFDILHFHEPWVPMLSRQILSRSRSVNIATFHAKLPETVVSRTVASMVLPYTKAVLKNLDELTAVSEAAAEYVCSMTDAPVTIIPNGIDLSEFKTPKSYDPKEKKVRTLLYLGRLERRKGVIFLLDAYAELVKTTKNVRLVIAGDGPDIRKLQNRVYELDLPNVEFLGYVTDAEKHKLLRTSDLFCAPALYGESFGIVLLEAMASGLVTVASNNSGYSAVLQELGSISLVQPKNPVEFSRRIGVLLENDELRKLWRNWALEYVKQYDYAKIIDQYEEVYETAERRHKKSRDYSPTRTE